MVYTIIYVAIVESLACYTKRPQTTECFHLFYYMCIAYHYNHHRASNSNWHMASFSEECCEMLQ